MDAHLAKTVLWAVLGIQLCLLVVVTLFTAMDELRDRSPGYTGWLAFVYLACTTPRRCTELVPYAVFMGALAGLGVLARNGEITALRAAGVSVARLFAAAAAPALLTLAVNMALAEFAAPWGEARGAALKARAQTGDHIATETWLRSGGQFTNVGGYDDSGGLVRVRQFVFADGELTVARRAERARPQAQGWLLLDVAETRLGADRTEASRPSALPWATDVAPAALTAAAVVDPARLSLRQLAGRIEDLAEAGVAAPGHQVLFWSKALQPAAVLGLVLLAVGFVLGPLREVGVGTRLCAGIATGLAFKYLVDVFAPMSIVFAIPPWLAMAVPVAACWLAGAVFIRRL